MLITFILLSTIMFTFLAIVWSRNHLADAVIKVAFILMSICGIGIMINNPSLFLVSG